MSLADSPAISPPSTQVTGVEVTKGPVRDREVDAGGKILKWKDASIHDFRPRVVKFDSTGMRALRPIPPPGVHPRTYITIEDLPDLSRRFKGTESGRLGYAETSSWPGPRP